MKRCTECNKIKPETTEYFHKEKKGRGGLTSKCKDCRNAARKEQRRRKKVMQEKYEQVYQSSSKGYSTWKSMVIKIRNWFRR